LDSTSIPNKAVMGVPNLGVDRARKVAVDAALLARVFSPKMSGAAASRFYPVWGEGWFGVAWEHPYIWFQESGARPHTMKSLAGKTIPMWLNDPDGELRRKSPKAKVRRLSDGRVQVLVFRRAAQQGQRKNVWRNVNGQMVRKSVPASYPGAPGRIAVNRSQGLMRAGDVDPGSRNPGAIAKKNVGVRWRHPGLDARRFLARGIYVAAVRNGFPVGDVQYLLQGNNRPHSSFSLLIHGG
jgi:hypothetical protein